MKKLRKIIKEEIKKILIENPDSIDQFGASYENKDARAFGYYKNKFYGGYDSKIVHYELIGVEDKNFPKERYDFDYPGRLWLRKKVISFWEYPPKSKFKKIINDLEKFYKIKICGDSRWKLEVIDSKNKYEVDKDWEFEDVKFISIQDYIGSQKQIGKELSHVKSPMLKKKKKAISGVGSSKLVKGALPGEVPVQTRFRQRKGLGDGIVRLRKIIKEEIKTIKDINNHYFTVDLIFLYVNDKFIKHISKASAKQIARKLFKNNKDFKLTTSCLIVKK